jgi:hypothetical protein
LVEFRGVFELHYFLQRLDAAHEQHKTILQHTEIIRVSANTVFKPHAPQLLITHSFRPDDYSGCFTAAEDVWTLRRDLGNTFDIVVYPAVQIEAFPDRLRELRHVLVWVHIGHGDGDQGLQQAGGEFKAAEEWLSCFEAYDKSLSLALFSSCRSDIVARKFAEAGGGVSIGFRKEVPKNLCREMTVAVVRAAFESGGNRDRILEAFRRKKERFAGAEPVAFLAKH